MSGRPLTPPPPLGAKILRRFFQPVRQAPGLFARALVVNTLYACYPLSLAFATKHVTDALSAGDADALARTMLWFALGSLAYYAVTWFIRHWGWADMHFPYLRHVHAATARAFLRLDHNATETIGTGRLIASFDKGMHTWVELLVQSAEYGARLGVALLACAWFLAGYGAAASAAAAALFALAFWTLSVINRGAILARAKRIAAKKEYVRDLVRVVMSKFEILSSRRTDAEVARLDAASRETQKWNYLVNDQLWKMSTIPSVLVLGMALATFATVGTAALRGEATPGDVAAATLYVALLSQTIGNFATFYKNFTADFAHLADLWSLLDDTPATRPAEEGAAFSFARGALELRGVTCAYGAGEPVLRDFSLTLAPGKKTALVGPSGSGKTTVAKLVAGYLAPKSGMVLADGQDLAGVRMDSYWPHVGYLTQEPSVFDGTVRENLEYAARGPVVDADLARVLGLAQCDFVAGLERGLDTHIGERGVRLSGGQKQRLAIAKIFLKNPEIIILDEPTSALDSMSEDKISQAFHALFAGRTVLIVAHRLQTVREADDIVVLENGRVAERGTHARLLENRRTYWRMVDLQAGF